MNQSSGNDSFIILILISKKLQFKKKILLKYI